MLVDYDVYVQDFGEPSADSTTERMFEGKLKKFVIMYAAGEKKGYNHLKEFEETGVDKDTYLEDGKAYYVNLTS